MHTHLSATKGYNKQVKMAETLYLSVFATNVLRIAKEKNINLSQLSRDFSIRSAALYEMRLGKYLRYVPFYTMVRYATALGEDISTLLTPTSDYINSSELIRASDADSLSGCIKMNQKQYASFRGVTTPTICNSVKLALKKNSLASLPCVVSIERYGVKGYVLYVKI